MGLVAAAMAIAVPLAQGPASQPTFRTRSDVILVEAQVIDDAGRPITGLTPKDFQVSIDGKGHSTVALEYRDYALASTRSPVTVAPDPLSAASAVPADTGGRLFVFAVDTWSFPDAGARGVAIAAMTFVDRLAPTDEVALITIPSGPRVDRTIDRTALRSAMEKLVGRGGQPAGARYTASEIVDCGSGNRASPISSEICAGVVGRMCPGGGDNNCSMRVWNDVRSSAAWLEQRAHQSLQGLREAIAQLKQIPGRKFLMLLSGGLVLGDVPGTIPDVGDLPMEVGKSAADANVTMYTLFIDPSFWQTFAAESRARPNEKSSVARDSALLGRGLDIVTGAAGGRMFRDVIGNGEYGFDRVLRETSGMYVLGVDQASTPRDGQLHRLRVQVPRRGATVRARPWVLLEKG